MSRARALWLAGVLVFTVPTLTVSLAASAAEAAVAMAGAPAPATVSVRLETSLGPIMLQIETVRAPLTAANFLRYVDNKRLDGTSFYRAMKIGDEGDLGLVQGGLRGNSRRVFKPIAHEPTTLTGLSHITGALSMARSDPGTATADFFIVLGDLSSLDARPDDPGYAVFGRVIDGMDVVRKLLDLPRTDRADNPAMKGQMLEAPVKIISARRVP